MSVQLRAASASVATGLESPAHILKKLETAGRISHASVSPNVENAAEKFVASLVRMGHESVLEHHSVTVFVECDRATSHQWVRHRLASYTMESQRYVNMTPEKHGIAFIDPEPTLCGLQWKYENLSKIAEQGVDIPQAVVKFYDVFIRSCESSATAYNTLKAIGSNSEDSRAVLPNSTSTRFYTTANLRSWRHFFKERCCHSAQHNIRKLAIELLMEFNKAIPCCFSDIVASLDSK